MNPSLVLYALLAALAVAAAVVVALSRSVTRCAHALGVVALTAAGLVGIFANAPMVAAGLVLLQGGVIAAVYLVGHMVANQEEARTPVTERHSRRRHAAPKLVLGAAATLTVVLGVIALTPGSAPTVAVQAVSAGADSLRADAISSPVADGESLTGLLVRRHLVSFSVIGFVLLAATLAIVESNRVDDPASTGEDP